MINYIKLNNFRKHTALTVNFTQGLQTMRSGNESGKTTLLEAIGYALWGTVALRTTLEETVTYDQPASSLKVMLELTLDGVDYTITRGKSGCEIRYADQSVTGQTETKLFMERLLGVTAQLSAKLLFANQTDIRGVLEDGPTAASSLIETLADLGQIEALVGKIQEQLPCGNTATLSGQIADCLSDLSEPEPLPPSDTEKNAASAVVATLTSELAGMNRGLDILKVEAASGRSQIADQAKIAAVNASISNRRKVLQEVEPKNSPDISEESLTGLRAEQADSTGREKKYKSSLKVFAACPPFVGTREEFYAHQKEQQEALRELRKQAQVMELKKATIEALHINETTCGFCKKDLTSIPEVMENNKAAGAKVAQLALDLKAARAEEAALEKLLDAQVELERADRDNQKLADAFWSASSQMPAAYSWIGGEVSAPGEDVGPKIVAIERLWADYRKQSARYAAAQEELLTLAETPMQLNDVWQTAIDAEQIAVTLVKSVEAALAEARVKLAEREGEFTVALHVVSVFKDGRARDTARLAILKAKLEETAENNELVKKLRAARPVIANKLWVTVLGTVGHYFSQIRGVRSIISKDDTGFKSDGRSVAGLSGSTKDALGLALRLALVKTFVPNASFVSLDEPASGCDAGRELAMLGVVAGAGFEQTLLVTHSDLADSFAAQVIQL